MTEYTCKIESVVSAAGGTRVISMTAAPDFPPFLAGQYLLILDGDNPAIPFSIASAPHRLPSVELHHQPVPGHPDNARLDRLFAEASLQVSAPQGACHLAPTTPTNQAIFMIGAGSGIAQLGAMVDHLIAQQHRATVRVFHGVRTLAYAYHLEYWRDRTAAHPWLHYQLVISESDGNDPAAAPGATAIASDVHAQEYESGLVGDLVLTRHADELAAATTYISGGPEAVYGIFDTLAAAGLSIGGNVFADAFDYAPRGSSS